MYPTPKLSWPRADQREPIARIRLTPYSSVSLLGRIQPIGTSAEVSLDQCSAPWIGTYLEVPQSCASIIWLTISRWATRPAICLGKFPLIIPCCHPGVYRFPFPVAWYLTRCSSSHQKNSIRQWICLLMVSYYYFYFVSHFPHISILISVFVFVCLFLFLPPVVSASFQSSPSLFLFYLFGHPCND